MWGHAKRSSQHGVKGNFKGDGTVMGGILLVTKDGVMFEHKEENPGDGPADPKVLKKMLEACRSVSGKSVDVDGVVNKTMEALKRHKEEQNAGAVCTKDACAKPDATAPTCTTDACTR